MAKSKSPIYLWKVNSKTTVMNKIVEKIRLIQKVNKSTPYRYSNNLRTVKNDKSRKFFNLFKREMKVKATNLIF